MCALRDKTPKVFISYSWDDEELKNWVLNLASRLRKDGVDVTLDQWHIGPGEELPEFMEKSVRENDFVLIVCTPSYKKKSDSRKGGVGYEGNIMTAEAYITDNKQKFIPILKHGDWASASPSWLSGKYYIDFRDTEYLEQNYPDLLATLFGYRPKAPPIGVLSNDLVNSPHNNKTAVFDNGHNLAKWNRGGIPTLTGNFKTMARILSKNYYVKSDDLYNFSLDRLHDVDYLFLVCPKDYHYSYEEIENLVSFVGKGGNLILFSYYWWSCDHNSNIGEVTREFGITLKDDRIFDAHNYFANEYQPLCKCLFSNLTNKQTIVPFCCSMLIEGSVLPILCSSEKAQSEIATLVDRRIVRQYEKKTEEELTIAAKADFHDGTLVVFGSWEMFLDQFINNSYYGNNELLGGLLSWIQND